MKTNVALILDRSGSMETVKVETVSGFNEELETLRSMETPEHQIGVTLTVFGTTVDTLFVNMPVNEVAELTAETYVPKGWTALYDAVGSTIVKLEDEISASEDDAFLVKIFSDGEENQSKEYTGTSLSAVIHRLKTTNKWTFSYLGSNQDLGMVRETLGVDVGNLCSYSGTKSGTTTAFAASRTGTKRYLRARASGQSSSSCLYSDDGLIADAESVVSKTK